MKSFRKLVSEVAQPKAEDEKHFKDKHVVEKIPHTHAGDETFKGSTKKTPKRRADYEEGDDAAVYEAMDPVGKEDDDIDNDGDVDSSDKYLHRRRKAIAKAMKKEEAEDLDEVSKDLLGRYAAKAHNRGDMAARMSNHGRNKDMANIANKRYYGIKNAINKLSGRARVNATEEVELDEAKTDIYHKHMLKALGKSRLPKNHSYTSAIANNGDFVVKDGGGRTVGRIAKGEHNLSEQQLDELSPNTLKSYSDKANKSLDKLEKQRDAVGKSMSKTTAAIGKRSAAEKAAHRATTQSQHNKATAAYRAADKSAKKNLAGHDDLVKQHSQLTKKINKRMDGIDRAYDKMHEEVEQLDELSPNTLHSYIKGASKDLAKRSSMAGYDARSRAYNNTLKNKKKADKRMAGIASASGRLADKANMAENAWEEVPMMMRQLQFIEYAAGEISDYLNMGVDPEEWFQNKLAGLHQTMLSMYAYAQGEMQMSGGMYGEETELDESQRSLDAHKFKQAAKVKAGIPLRRPGESLVAYVTRKAKAQAKMQKEEAELDEANVYRVQARNTDTYKVTHHDVPAKSKAQAVRIAKEKHGGPNIQIHNNPTKLDEATPTKKAITRALQGMKVQPKDKVSLKKAPWEKNEDLDEVTRSAIKRPVRYTDIRGVTRTRWTTTRPVQHDQYGQEKIKESLQEAVKPGKLKLDDGSSITVSKKDADLLNQMFNDLNTKNRKMMQDTMMSDKAGFEEIVGFAREAL